MPAKNSPQHASSPAVRASAVRDTLAYLDKFEPGSRQRVLALVPPASREIIEAAPSSAWIPLEHDHWTIDAMIEVFGRDRAIECWRGALANLVDRPLLRNFVSSMLKVMGRSPVSVVRLFAKGWPLVYRDVCEPTLIVARDNQPTIRFEDISPVVRTYSNYLHSWHGACQGFAFIAQVQGRVTFEVAPDLSWAEAKFYWDER